MADIEAVLEPDVLWGSNGGLWGHGSGHDELGCFTEEAEKERWNALRKEVVSRYSCITRMETNHAICARKVKARSRSDLSCMRPMPHCLQKKLPGRAGVRSSDVLLTRFLS